VDTHVRRGSDIIDGYQKEATMAQKVRVVVGFTQNIGNYESLRTGIELEDTLEPRPEVAQEDVVRPGETFEDAADRLFEKAEAILVAKARDNLEHMTAEARKASQIKPKRG
jgi:hypothetical protein